MESGVVHSDGSDARRKLLQAAEAEVRASGIEERLWPVAFGKLFDALYEEGRVNDGERSRFPDEGASGGAEESLIQRIARHLGLATEIVDETFFENDGQVGVALPPSKLEDSKKAATRQLATLVVLGNQAAGISDWTPVAEIRNVCNEFGVLDIPNFAATISRMDDILQVRGKGQYREARLRRPGLEVAKHLLINFAGRSASEK